MCMYARWYLGKFCGLQHVPNDLSGRANEVVFVAFVVNFTVYIHIKYTYMCVLQSNGTK